MQTSPGSAAPSRAELALIALSVLVHVFLLPHSIYGDAEFRFQTLNALAHGTLDASKYPLIQPLLSLPLYAAGGRRAVAWFSELVFLGGLGGIAALLRRAAGAAIARRTVLLLLTCSMFTHHVQTYYGETLTAVALSLGLLLVCRGRTGAGASVCAIGALNAPASVPAFAAGLLAADRRRSWRTLLPVVAVVALLALEAWARRGSPLRTGYEGDRGFRTMLPYSGLPGFSYPMLFGLLSELLSFGKGILFFAPGLLLGWPEPEGELRGVHRSWLLVTAVLLVTYAKWWAWYGGWFWGPRFLLFAAMPASLALAHELSREGTSRARRAAAFVVLALSAWVGIDGAVFGQYDMQICESHGYALEALCWYVPEMSALARPFVAPRPLTAREIVVVADVVASAAVLAVPLMRTLRVRRNL